MLRSSLQSRSRSGLSSWWIRHWTLASDASFASFWSGGEDTFPPSLAGFPHPSSDNSDGGDDILSHFIEQRITRRVSGQHHIQFPVPNAKTVGTAAGRVGSRIIWAALSETRTWDGPTIHLRVLRPDRAAVGGQYARSHSPHLPLHGPQRT